MLIFLHFLSNFGSKLAVSRRTIAGKSASWGLPGRLGDATLTSCSSWLRFGPLLDPFWKGSGMIFNHFRPILQFFFIFGFRFLPFFAIWLHCFLYLVRLTPRPTTNIDWPGGLREAIKSAVPEGASGVTEQLHQILCQVFCKSCRTLWSFPF